MRPASKCAIGEFLHVWTVANIFTKGYDVSRTISDYYEENVLTMTSYIEEHTPYAVMTQDEDNMRQRRPDMKDARKNDNKNDREPPPRRPTADFMQYWGTRRLPYEISNATS
jgi:hypothetical protein